MAHIVEIWEMQGDEATVWTPACLSCGWVSAGGPRPVAETEAELHEAGGSALTEIAREPRTDLRRSPDPPGRPLPG